MGRRRTRAEGLEGGNVALVAGGLALARAREIHQIYSKIFRPKIATVDLTRVSSLHHTTSCMTEESGGMVFGAIDRIATKFHRLNERSLAIIPLTLSRL